MSENIFNQIEWVQNQIAEACARVGRSPEEVKLIAVSKKKDVTLLKQAIDAGLTVFGESKVQEAKVKIPMLPNYCEWHYIGPIQSNKIKDIGYFFSTIHSVEKQEQLDELEIRAKALGRNIKILVQVNIGRESSKHGVYEEDAEAFVIAANEKPHLEVIGLMCIAPVYEDLERVRTYFIKMRELKEQIEANTGFILPELSMGMSYDFAIAIEEGATMVRIGRALLGKWIINGNNLNQTADEDTNGDL
jgi:hypothetical protein